MIPPRTGKGVGGGGKRKVALSTKSLNQQDPHSVD